MQTRPLGKTELQASAIGLGCAQLGSSSTPYAVQIVQRALEMGVTYLDVARGYRDAETKIGLALDGQREGVILSTKTGAKTRDDAWAHLGESLKQLRTDYVDNLHLHGLRSGDDMDQRLGPGGALEALIEARDQGVIGHIGCTSHHAATLVEALDRFPFEIILVPMNIVERDPLRELIPLCKERGVGVTIMKPVATGLLPAGLALKWLLNQPISSAVPGATTVCEVEENARVGHLDQTLSAAEMAEIEAERNYWDTRRCRICGECLPCPAEVHIPSVLGTDVMYDHYRTMGAEGFRSFSWSRAAVEGDLPGRRETIAAIEACTDCGECEPRCPHGLPIREMLRGMLPAMRDMVAIYQSFLSD
ncbi:MAG: aldo/keto reductase [Anaerolineae bacterium]|nr:aldo/keto reductase [Anaerolineae bacterium]